MEVEEERIEGVGGLPDYRDKKKRRRDMTFEREVESYLFKIYKDARKIIEA